MTSWKVCEPARLQHIGWILCAQGSYCWADGSLTTRTLQAGPSRSPPSAVLLESTSRFTSLIQLCYTQALLAPASTRKTIVVGSRHLRIDDNGLGKPLVYEHPLTGGEELRIVRHKRSFQRQQLWRNQQTPVCSRVWWLG